MKFRLLWLSPLLGIFILFSTHIAAHEGHEEHDAALALNITDLRIKAPIPGQTISAGYMHVNNLAGEDVAIIGVSSRSASKIEMHTHTMRDGMMMMQKIDSVEIPANGSVVFKEGGYHLMVFNPDADAIRDGTLRLVFELDTGYVIPVMGKVEHLVPQNEPTTNSHSHH